MLFAAMVSYTLNVNWVNCPIICLTIGVQSEKLGTTWEQTLTNTVQNRDARHRKMLDEPTTWRFCSCLGRGRPLVRVPSLSPILLSPTRRYVCTVINPEPSSILLLVSGLCAIGFGICAGRKTQCGEVSNR